MLNIQNPSLFGNSPAQGWGGNTETNTLGTFFAAEGNSGRRREYTSTRFLGRDIQDDESTLGDPAWHRETQVAIQGSEGTESSDTCGCGVHPVVSLNLLLYFRCRTSTSFFKLMIIRSSSSSWLYSNSQIFPWFGPRTPVQSLSDYWCCNIMMPPSHGCVWDHKTYGDFAHKLLTITGACFANVCTKNQGHLHENYLSCHILTEVQIAALAYVQFPLGFIFYRDSSHTCRTIEQCLFFVRRW